MGRTDRYRIAEREGRTAELIEQEKIEEVKRQTDIVDIIGRYVQLKKMGKNYRGLCPFHSEKNPSFYVNPEKGIYYCFGCKKGGNAINFLMEYEKLDFPDAIKRLAKNLGIEIDTTKGLRYKELYEVNEQACQFYAHCLTKDIGRRGQEYLLRRNMKLDKLQDFRLGYAPASGGLTTFMRQKGFSVARLQQAGLISTNRELFRDRLIFPIFNLSGRIIGFGGRGIDDFIQPKYLNSPETPIFKKGDGLYGLYQSKEKIRSKGEVMLVEGYFDLLSIYQHGFDNISAPLGTSLTEQQALLLSRFARKAMILFDGDLSGIKAALRAIGLLIDAQVDVFVTLLPENSDPDTFINAQGAEALQELVGNAADFFHFYKGVVKTDTVAQEIALIKDLIQIIGRIKDPIRYDRYLKYAAHVFDIPVETIQKEINGKVKTPKRKIQTTRISQEEELMAMILSGYEYFGVVKKYLKSDDFIEDGIKRLFKKLLKEENFDIAELSEIVDEVLREKLLAGIMRGEPVSEEGMLDAIKKYKGQVMEKRLIKKQNEAYKRGDEAAGEQYNKELLALKRELLNINTENAASGEQ
ncbi:MAG: DNA primase [candidate division WOR-3 bacterium]|nr:MAG: DNA primase [candidate division WOR-3 bacterium]